MGIYENIWKYIGICCRLRGRKGAEKSRIKWEMFYVNINGNRNIWEYMGIYGNLWEHIGIYCRLRGRNSAEKSLIKWEYKWKYFMLIKWEHGNMIGKVQTSPA